MIKFAQLFSRLNNTKSQDADKAVSTDEIDIEQELQRLALRKIFQQQQFSMLDGLNEYDEDFSLFSARGELITHDMLRMAKRLMQAQDEESVTNTETVKQDPNQDDTKSA